MYTMNICVELLLSLCLSNCVLVMQIFHMFYNNNCDLLHLLLYMPCQMCEFLCQLLHTRHKFLFLCVFYLLLHLHSNSMSLLQSDFLLQHIHMLNMNVFCCVLQDLLSLTMHSMNSMCDPILVSTLYTCGLLLLHCLLCLTMCGYNFENMLNICVGLPKNLCLSNYDYSFESMLNIYVA